MIKINGKFGEVIELLREDIKSVSRRRNKRECFLKNKITFELEKHIQNLTGENIGVSFVGLGGQKNKIIVDLFLEFNGYRKRAGTITLLKSRMKLSPEGASDAMAVVQKVLFDIFQKKVEGLWILGIKGEEICKKLNHSQKERVYTQFHWRMTKSRLKFFVVDFLIVKTGKRVATFGVKRDDDILCWGCEPMQIKDAVKDFLAVRS